jgi:uncharacterized membrane protein
MTQPSAKRGTMNAAKTPRRPTPRRAAPSKGAGVVAATATLGAVGAGVALLEAAALFIALGGAVVLAPRLWREVRGRRKPAALLLPPPPEPEPSSDAETRFISLPGFKIKQALGKSITYRVVITACDVSWNYAILGEAAAAAGLSAISLAAGTIFYFVHETGWNRFGPPAGKEGAVSVPLPALGWSSGAPDEEKREIAVERSVAKTVTFRAFATVTEFTTNFFVVGDLATAATLTAFGFVLGPFIYLGHEKVWELADAPKPPEPRRLAQASPAE